MSVDQIEGKELQFLLHIFDAAAHQALGRVDDAVGRGGERRIRGIANDDLPGVGKATTEGTRFEPSSPGMIDRLIALHKGDERIGRPEVDSSMRASAIDIRCFLAFQRFVYVAHEVADVAPAVEERNDFVSDFGLLGFGGSAVDGCVPARP